MLSITSFFERSVILIKCNSNASKLAALRYPSLLTPEQLVGLKATVQDHYVISSFSPNHWMTWDAYEAYCVPCHAVRLSFTLPSSVRHLSLIE